MRGRITPRFPYTTVLRLDGEARPFRALRIGWGGRAGQILLEIDGEWCPLVSSYFARREQQTTSPRSLLQQWLIGTGVVGDPEITCTIEVTTAPRCSKDS